VLVPLVVLASVVGCATAVAAVPAKKPAGTKLTKLPERLKTPTGNFITLYAVKANGAAESFDVSICTSAHTPVGTEAIPSFFSLLLSNGTHLPNFTVSPLSPPLRVTPLGPKQCVRGWITFTVPQGAHAVELFYTYGSPIKWKVG